MRKAWRGILGFCLLQVSAILLAAVSVAVSPAVVTLKQGGGQTFTAAVSGSTNKSVTWSVTGTGNGSVTASGAYIAPAKSGTFKVRATSKADTRVYGEATVTVAPPVSVSIAPALVTLTAEGGLKFGFAISNATNPQVVWSVIEAGGGTVDGSGKYTAPATPGIFTVQVASVEDPSRIAQAKVTAVAAPDSTMTAPNSVTAGASGLQASVPAQAATTYAWSISGGTLNAGQTSNGITFTAGSGASVMLTCKVTNAAGDSFTSTKTLPIQAAQSVAISISPSSVTLAPGGTQRFTATVTGSTNQNTKWSYNGGTLVQSGGGMLFTAPSKTGTYTITAASVADPARTAKATILVAANVPVGVTLLPAMVTLPMGGTQAFTAKVTGTTSNYGVTWSSTDGTVDGNGVFTAPNQAGTCTVTATSLGDPAKSATATVLVFNSADLGNVGLTPANASVAGGGTIAISATVLGSSQGVTWSAEAGSWSYSNTLCNFTAGYRGTPLPEGTYTLTATSIEFPEKSLSLEIQVYPPGTVVGITPGSAGCGLGEKLSFSAVVLGEASQSVVWAASAGAITPEGEFTAPTVETDVTITATSLANSTKKGTAVVTVTDPANLGKVVLSTAEVAMAAGRSATITALSKGSSQGVAWRVSGGKWSYDKTRCTFIAEDHGAPLTPGVYTLIATSIEFPNQSAQAAIHVYPVGTTVVITPGGAGLLPGAQVGFSSRVLEEANQEVTWSLVGGGALSSLGLYTAPLLESSAIVTATSVANLTKSASVRVGVSLLEHMGLVTVKPSEAILRAGEIQTFEAAVQGSSQGVRWALEGGTVLAADQQATYTAGDTPGIFEGSASSDINGAPAARVKIQIYPASAGLGIVPQKARVLAKTKLQFATTFFGGQNQPVTWSASAGSIDSNGLFTAPGILGDLTIAACSTQDGTKLATAVVTVHDDPVIDTFTASPTELYEGQKVAVKWVVRNATSIQVQDIQHLPSRGELSVPGENRIQIIAKNAQSQASNVIDLLVIHPEITDFDATPKSFNPGDTVTVQASFLNGTGRLKLRTFGGEKDLGPILSGEPWLFQPQESASLVLEVTGAGGAIHTMDLFLGRLGAGPFASVHKGTLSSRSPQRIFLDRDGSVLIADGRDKDYFKVVERYDPVAGTTLSLGRLLPDNQMENRDSVLGADGAVMAIGGIAGHTFNGYCYSYNDRVSAPLASVWSWKRPDQSMVSGVYGHSMAALPNNGILLYGGNSCPPLADWCCDTATVRDSWLTFFKPGEGWGGFKSLVDRSGGWGGKALVLADGRVLVGGRNAEIFSLADGTSVLLGHWPTGPMIALASGQVLTLGAQELLWWDPDTGVERRQPSCLGAFNIASATQLPDGKLLLLGSQGTEGLLLDLDSSQATLYKLPAASAGAALLPNGNVFCLNGEEAYSIEPVYAFRIQPSRVVQSPGERVQFSVATGDPAGVTWSVDGGSISADGSFECGDSGTYRVTAHASNGAISYAWIDQSFGPLSAEAWVVPNGGSGRANNPLAMQPSGKAILKAILNNHPNQSFTWTIEEGAAGGTIEDSVYVAPAQSGTYHLVATSQFDPRYFARLTMLVDTVALAIGPESAQVDVGGTLQFRYSMAPGGRVIWSCQGGGSIDSNGRYTAPAAPCVSTIMVRSVDNPAKWASAQVTVTLGQIRVKLAPKAATLKMGQPIQFSLALSSPGKVMWSADGGSLSQDGVFIAPMRTGSFHVVATSVDNPACSATALVTVVDGLGLEVTPASAELFGGMSLAFKAAVFGIQNQGVTWSVVEADSGTITADGGYTAPPAVGVYAIKAVSTFDPGLVATAQVTVAHSEVAVAIAPKTGTIYLGQKCQFACQVLAPSNRVLWTCSGGTITEQGAYTAPATPGTYQVTVTSVDDPSRNDSCVMTVKDITLLLAPTSVNLAPGTTYQFGYSYEMPAESQLVWSAAGGTITQTGLYTAPQAEGVYRVSVACSLFPDRVRTAVVSVGSFGCQIVPKIAVVAPGKVLKFQVILPSGSAVWSVVEPGGGTISTQGLYTAPLMPGTYTIKVSPAADTSRFSTAKVLVSAAGGGGWGSGSSTVTNPSTHLSLTLFPTELCMDAGTHYPFQATVGNTDVAKVAWKVKDDPSEASIDGDGVFTASKQGIYQVTATLVADATLSATAQVIVLSALKNLENPLAGLRGYSVTSLDNGKVLIAGGTPVPADLNGATTAYSTLAWLYDFATKEFSPTGNLLTPRCDAYAVKLKSGKVLLAGGYGRWADPWLGGPSTPWKGEVYGHSFPFAELYDPDSGTFLALPAHNPGLSSPIGTLEAPGRMITDHGYGGGAIELADGRVWFSGGAFGWASALAKATFSEPAEVFTPGSGYFQSVDFGMRNLWAFHGLASLPDGRVFVTQGLIPRGRTSAAAPALASQNAGILNSATGQAESLTSVLKVGRFGNTVTQMADGKLLIVGGGTGTGTYNNSGDFSLDYSEFEDTATAEVFDPATNTTTLVGSLHQSRRNHAALLLPTGQVLIAGGVHHVGVGAFVYPNSLEVFDPETRAFSVMDYLDYGLSEPKLVLLNDGSVFIAGQVQGPMEAPPASSQANGLRMMAANASGVNALTTGMSLFGHTTSFAPIAGPMFMNQGVDRMVADANDRRWDGTAIPGQVWRSSVPRIAGRDTLIHGTFISPLPLAASKAKQLRYDVYLNGSTKAGLTDLPLATQDSSGFRFWAKENQWGYTFVVDGATATKDATLQVKLNDPTGTILASGSWQEKDLQTDVMKPWTDTAAPMTVKLVRVKYIYKDGNTRKVEWVGKTDPNEFTAATSAAEACIKSHFPVATGLRIVAPQNDAFFVCSEDYKDENGNLITARGSGVYSDGSLPPFNMSQPGGTAWGTVHDFLPEWVTSTPTLGIDRSQPANTFVALIVPRIAGHTCLVNGGNARGVGSHSDHFVLYLDSTGVADGKEVIAHELGHAHGRDHVQWPLTGSVPDPPFDTSFPTTFPYTNGAIGVVGWDPSSGTKSPDTFKDIMTYGTPRWISDYTFYWLWKYDYDMWPGKPK